MDWDKRIRLAKRSWDSRIRLAKKDGIGMHYAECIYPKKYKDNYNTYLQYNS